MRSTFSGYYRPTEDEFTRLWETCTFAFDANVLLKFYRYKPETREQLFQILLAMAERIWIPYQAALEYQRNRLGVIAEQTQAYDEVTSEWTKLRESLNRYNRRHPVLAEGELRTTLDGLIEQGIQALNEAKQHHPEMTRTDPIRERISDLFEGKVGQEPTGSELADWQKEAHRRIEKRIPPGFKDNKKGEDRQYGDYILWTQVLNHSKDNKCNIILVTDDTKEDWWEIVAGEYLGPRPELVDEFHKTTGNCFHTYSTLTFMRYAAGFFKITTEVSAVENVREVFEQTRFDDSITLLDQSQHGARSTVFILTSSTGLDLDILQLKRNVNRLQLETAMAQGLPVKLQDQLYSVMSITDDGDFGPEITEVRLSPIDLKGHDSIAPHQ